MARNDGDIQADVLDEMVWDPKVTVADVGATVENGYVTLTGTASTYATKYAATDAAFRVYGVTDVENDIVVDPAAFGLRSDEQLAADVRSMLVLDLNVPDTHVTISVMDGVVTLGGDVDFPYQRDAAEDDAASIYGVRDVVSTIAIMEQPSAFDISTQLAAAFARHGELFDDNIVVTTSGHSVALSGTVRNWGEYDEAEDVAWRAAGVTSVTNNIAVTY